MKYGRKFELLILKADNQLTNSSLLTRLSAFYRHFPLPLFLFLLVEQLSFAQTNEFSIENSVAIKTTSARDSLIFRIRPKENTGLRIFFEDRLQGSIPPFKEKYFAIEPQSDWSCIGLRDTQTTVDIIIYEDCDNARDDTLKELYEAKDIPIIMAAR